jgi:hypothetical protein
VAADPPSRVLSALADPTRRDMVARLAVDDGRTLLTATSLVDSFEARDAFVASGMEGGVREGHERLDELLAS